MDQPSPEFFQNIMRIMASHEKLEAEAKVLRRALGQILEQVPAAVSREAINEWIRRETEIALNEKLAALADTNPPLASALRKIVDGNG